jgi:hypothetical protein
MSLARALLFFLAIRRAWEGAAGYQHPVVREHVWGGRPHQPPAIVMLPPSDIYLPILRGPSDIYDYIIISSTCLFRISIAVIQFDKHTLRF